ncbi:hypothetical protein ACQ4M4_02010 [Leptolyngbya sp. AN02str]
MVKPSPKMFLSQLCWRQLYGSFMAINQAFTQLLRKWERSQG